MAVPRGTRFKVEHDQAIRDQTLPFANRLEVRFGMASRPR